MAGHVEIESTFDVDATFVVPDLLTLPGVATIEQPQVQHLEAQYFDTTDLRLLRAKITLRRRTGGDDAGWHLKLPVAMSARTSARLEVHRPLGRSSRVVPIALSRLVRVRVREAGLVPSARLTTRRTVSRLLDADGVVMAELADDEVLAEALPADRSGEVSTSTWREIEVELVKGDEALLEAAGERLIAAGARPAAIGSKVGRALQSRLAGAGTGGSASAEPDRAAPSARRGRSSGPAPVVQPSAADVLSVALRERIERVLGWDPHVRAQTPGAVDAMRLATRELRSLLAGLAPVLPRSQVSEVRAGLRHFGGLLAELRTAEVLHERVIAAIAALPPELIIGPVTRRADLEFSARSREALSAVHSELDSPGYLDLAAALDELSREVTFSKAARDPAEQVLAGIVRGHLSKLGAAVDAFGVAVPPVGTASPASGHTRIEAILRVHEAEALRAIGKAVKRARFVTEVVAPLAGPDAESTARTLATLQDVVSVHRQGVAMRAALRELGLHASMAGQNAFTFGLMHGLELANDAMLLDEVPGEWRSVRRAARVWPA